MRLTPGRMSGKNTRLKTVGLAVLFLYAGAALIFAYAMILYPMMGAAATLGMGGAVMAVVVLISMLAVLIFGTMTLIGMVFTAKDAEFYAALPLRPQSVFFAKFGMVYLTELGITALLMWPAGIIYCMYAGFSLWFFIKLLVLWLLLPAIPLAISTIIAMPLVRLTAFSRHRDALVMIISLVMVVAVVVGQVWLQNSMRTTIGDPSELEAILSNQSGLISQATASFPPALWCARALVDSGSSAIGGFLLFLLSVIAGMTLCLFLSKRLYMRGVLAQLEAARGKTRGYSAKGVRSGTALGAFLSKELKLLSRTPIYATNALTGIIVFPLMIVIMIMSGEQGTKEYLNSILSMLPPEMSVLIAAAFVMLLSLISIGVSTSFSREGSMIWICQTVPVPVKTQVAARILAGYIISTIGAAISVAVLTMVMSIPVATALAGAVIGLICSAPLLCAAIIPDAIRPKRKWSSEAEAMKQNMNSVYAMFLDFGIGLCMILLTVGLVSLSLPVWLVAALVSIAALAAGWALFILAAKLAEKMLKTVEG